MTVLPGTYVQMFRRRALETPDKIALTVLTDGARESATVGFGAIDRRARAIAVRVAELADAAPDASEACVGIAIGAGLAFVETVLGCFYAGVPAVPVPAGMRGRGAERTLGVLTDAGVIAILVEDDAETPHLSSLGLPIVATPAIPDALGDAWVEPAIGARSPAFLQYTSGSTALPKGVVITHGALLANMEMMRVAFGADPSWSSLTWMPPHHDMGLVGGLLQPLAFGGRTVVIPPLFALQRPLRVLQAIAKYQVVVCGGPNFFFEACADRYDAAACEGLDLSSWRVAFCGAEPVRPAGLARFAERYAPHGFDASALHPCYGLAEATLFVTAGEPRHGIETLTVDSTALPQGRVEIVAPDDPKARTVVSCGWPRSPAGVAIVDPETRRAVADGTIGEIWLNGPHLASGYWRRPVETAGVFGAWHEGSDEAFCRTGDLGFVADRRLYVVGRIKDVIVRNGVKYHAEDVEHAVRGADPALETAACAAFGVDDGKLERLVVAIESRRAKNATAGELDAFSAQVRAQVLASVGIRLDEVLIVGPGVLPRTTSGKIQRRQCQAVLATDRSVPALAASTGQER